MLNGRRFSSCAIAIHLTVTKDFSNKCAKMSIWAGRDLRKPPVRGLVGSYEGSHPKGWLPMKLFSVTVTGYKIALKGRGSSPLREMILQV